MFKLRLAAAAAAAALVTVAGAGAAFADDGYTNPPGTGTGPTGAVQPGAEFTVSFESAVSCDPWTLSFQGQDAAPGTGTSYSATLTAPTAPGTYTVTALCNYDTEDTEPAEVPQAAPAEAGVAKVTQAAFVAAPAVQPYSVQIVVAGASAGSGTSNNDGGGLLPDTGGANLGLLAAGGVLVAGGVAATVIARRRSA